MRVLVTGSNGHLGRALMTMLPRAGHVAVGLDLCPGPTTHITGSIADPGTVAEAMAGVEAVLHTATLHKPHVATHSEAAFVETNVQGTLTLLAAAAKAGVGAFVFSSTTSAFGAALVPPPDQPAAWIDEDIQPVPKNIYGATKTAAEDLCRLYARRGLPTVVLRLSRFFPEPDDDPAARAAFPDGNAKANEFLYRRVDLEDATGAHLAALDRAPALGWGRYIISATTPFLPEDIPALRTDAAAVAARRVPGLAEAYAAAGYRFPPRLDRVYDNARARAALGWAPTWAAAEVVAQIAAGSPIGSPLAQTVGTLGYHGDAFRDGLYPTG